MTQNINPIGQSPVTTFYDSLANAMKELGLRYLLVDMEQKDFNMSKSLFIPFDASDTDGKTGYGIFLLLHKIQTPKRASPCLVAAATLQLATPKNKIEVARLLHEINLHLPIPGWILNDKEDLLHFKYIFSGIDDSKKNIEVYLTIIVEILNGIAKSFPLLKDIIEGKPFDTIRDEIPGRLA